MVLNALHKDPAHRYPTAQAVADDLNHWLNREPVAARPAAIPRRLWLWSRRSPGWAAALLITVLSILAAGGGGTWFFRSQARAKEHELQIQAIERLRQGQHSAGWANSTSELIRQAADGRRDIALQARAAAAFAGLDAKLVKPFLGKVNSRADAPDALAFDRRQHLFFATPGGGITIWDPTAVEPRTVPVQQQRVLLFAIDPQGTALELVAEIAQGRRTGFLLQEVENQRVRRRYPVDAQDLSDECSYSLTPDGSLMALVSSAAAGSPARLRVWESASGNLVRAIPIEKGRPTDVALSPDGRLVALGFTDGQIAVWPLAEEGPATLLKDDRVQLNCLQFGPDVLRREDAQNERAPWLLAAGDSGGAVTIWDLHLRVPRSVCRGSFGDVLALAFRPDGMTLASSGRGPVKLWDIATGRLLLELPGGNYTYPLAFTADGKALAVGMHPAFGSSVGVNVWEIEDGRGIQELRGLRGLINQVIFSADGRWVASLSADWKVGIWDRIGHRLVHVLEVPVGFHADNAGMAFDPQARRFAFAAGTAAAVWDVETGKRLRTVPLPPGLVDNVVFAGDRLWSVRVETASGKVPPSSGSNPKDHPRVCRVRDLLAAEPIKALSEIRDFSWHVYLAQVSPDGRHLVVEGLGGQLEDPKRLCKLFELATGRELAVIPSPLSIKQDAAWFRFDPTGSVMTHLDKRGEWDSISLLAIPSLRSLESTESQGLILVGPGGSPRLERERDPLLNTSLFVVKSRGARNRSSDSFPRTSQTSSPCPSSPATADTWPGARPWARSRSTT